MIATISQEQHPFDFAAAWARVREKLATEPHNSVFDRRSLAIAVLAESKTGTRALAAIMDLADHRLDMDEYERDAMRVLLEELVADEASETADDDLVEMLEAEGYLPVPEPPVAPEAA